MDVDVTSEALIKRPRREVAEYAADPDNVPGWYDRVRRVAHAAAAQDRFENRVRRAFLGAKARLHVRDRRTRSGGTVGNEDGEGPFPMEITYTWETSVEAKLRLRNQGVPTGFARWLAPLITVAMRRATQRDLARLKRRLESGA